jgi:hypothetical protein
VRQGAYAAGRRASLWAGKVRAGSWGAVLVLCAVVAAAVAVEHLSNVARSSGASR